MTWQDVLGVRWRWRPRRAVRVVVAIAVTVVVVASLLLVLVCLPVDRRAVDRVLVATALLFLWIAEKWWIVVDPDNLAALAEAAAEHVALGARGRRRRRDAETAATRRSRRRLADAAVVTQAGGGAAPAGENDVSSASVR